MVCMVFGCIGVSFITFSCSQKANGGGGVQNLFVYQKSFSAVKFTKLQFLYPLIQNLKGKDTFETTGIKQENVKFVYLFRQFILIFVAEKQFVV